MCGDVEYLRSLGCADESAAGFRSINIFVLSSAFVLFGCFGKEFGNHNKVALNT